MGKRKGQNVNIKKWKSQKAAAHILKIESEFYVCSRLAEIGMNLIKKMGFNIQKKQN